MNVKKLLLLPIIALAAGIVHAQVTVAPTVIFMDETNPYGSLILINNTDVAQAVTVDFKYGFPDADEDGNVSITYSDDAEFSVAEKIFAFPEQTIIQPGMRHVIRLALQTNEEMADGTYSTRVITTSEPQTPPVSESDGESTSATVGYKFEYVTALLYEVGDLAMDLSVNNLSAALANDTLSITADFDVEGNSPFIGSVEIKVLDDRGHIARQSKVSSVVYSDDTRLYEIDVEGLARGSYTVELTASTSRNDIDASRVVQINPIVQTTSIRVR